MSLFLLLFVVVFVVIFILVKVELKITGHIIYNIIYFYLIMSRPLYAGALSDASVCLTSVANISLSQEQRGLGRAKLAQT